MDSSKWALAGLAGLLLVSYNLTQPGLVKLRTNTHVYQGTTNTPEGYGPRLDWLDRLARSSTGQDQSRVKLDFSVMSSLMVAGLASGFKSQVANLLWMKSDEYWHEGLFTRQVPLMEAVVTLDPQFIDAWSTAGWHWAYNIYADIPSNPDYKKREKTDPGVIERAQDNAVETGLDYLKRGANMNPDTYRLWFEWGWTRAEKAGYYDKETLSHYEKAREQKDADIIMVTDKRGVEHPEHGLDILGRTIGHLYERIPDFPGALNMYGVTLMHLKPEEQMLLDKNGEYWQKYGEDYPVIAGVYNAGDAVTKAQIKKLIPDVDTLVQAAAMRVKIANRKGQDQPVGAYVSITARYMPAWKLKEAGDVKGAIALMIGVMNADPKYHLKGLPVMAKVYELGGYAPAAIKAQLDRARDAEKTSSQDLGLHFLAKLYEEAATKAKAKGDTTSEATFNKLAYETWYRSRSRDALDFYALRNTRVYEAKYNFKTPQNIVDEIKKTRQKGVPNAAPPVAPNVQGYY